MEILRLMKPKTSKRFVITLGGLVVIGLIVLALFSTETSSPALGLQSSPDGESSGPGSCPACGCQPDFACLKEDGGRYLHCSQCNTEWRFSRIGCPYCGNEDQGTLGYFYADTEGFGGCRIYVCEECKCYICTIDTREVSAASLWVFENIKLPELEKEVRAMGYRPGREYDRPRDFQTVGMYN